MTISTFLSIASFSTILFSALYTLWDQLKNAAASNVLPKGYVHDHAKSVDYLWEAEQAIPYATYLGSTQSDMKFDNPFSEEAEAHYRKEFTDKYQCDDTCYYDCMAGCEQGEFYSDALEGALRRFNARVEADYVQLMKESADSSPDWMGSTVGEENGAFDDDQDEWGNAKDLFRDPESDITPDEEYTIGVVILDEAYYLQDSEGTEYGPFQEYEPTQHIADMCALHGIDLDAYRIYVIACLNGCTHDEAIKHAVQEFKCRRNIVEVISPNNKSINI